MWPLGQNNCPVIDVDVSKVLVGQSCYLVILLLQHEDDVSGLDARSLVGFTRERDLLPMFHAFVHVHLQQLRLLTNFMTFTLLTAILLVDHLSCTHTAKGSAPQGEEKILPNSNLVMVGNRQVWTLKILTKSCS